MVWYWRQPSFISWQLKSRAACAIRLAYFAKMINSACFPLFKSNAALEIITRCISSKFEKFTIKRNYYIPTLTPPVTKATKILSNRKRFFIHSTVCYQYIYILESINNFHLLIICNKMFTITNNKGILSWKFYFLITLGKTRFWKYEIITQRFIIFSYWWNFLQ